MTWSASTPKTPTRSSARAARRRPRRGHANATSSTAAMPTPVSKARLESCGGGATSAWWRPTNVRRRSRSIA